MTKHKHPKALLEACLFHDKCQGGTIHTYLPRLKWKFDGRDGHGNRFVLWLDNKEIGLCWRVEPELPPEIEPHMTHTVLSCIEE